MSSSAPLLSNTIEADDETVETQSSFPKGNIGSSASSNTRAPEVLVPGTGSGSGRGNGRSGNEEEGGIVSDRYRATTVAEVDAGWYTATVIPPHVSSLPLPLPLGGHCCLRALRSM